MYLGDLGDMVRLGTKTSDLKPMGISTPVGGGASFNVAGECPSGSITIAPYRDQWGPALCQWPAAPVAAPAPSYAPAPAPSYSFNPSVSVNPSIQTNVSPQISPVFQQQFQPNNSPASAGTSQQTSAPQTSNNSTPTRPIYNEPIRTAPEQSQAPVTPYVIRGQESQDSRDLEILIDLIQKSQGQESAPVSSAGGPVVTEITPGITGGTGADNLIPSIFPLDLPTDNQANQNSLVLPSNFNPYLIAGLAAVALAGVYFATRKR